MDKQQTLELYEQGRDAWNTWAQEMLNRAERDSPKWEREAKADFSGYKFKNKADFSEFIFPSEVNFSNVIFNGIVEFRKTKFFQKTSFIQASFSNMAVFRESIFSGDVYFSDAKFSDLTIFSGVKFETYAFFIASQFESSFLLDRAKFSTVPDFTDAVFRDAPRLDHIHIDVLEKRNFIFQRGGKDMAAYWRVLKRLAMRAHDHERELIFFKEEVIARRFVEDKWYHGAFWFGIFYQALSDFGRAIVRPMIAWLFSVGIFFGVYRLLANATPPCQSPWSSALILSLHQGLVSLPGPDDKIRQIYGCLYGTVGGTDTPHIPDIPDMVAFLGTVQSVFSAILIFLLLLALRNRFRIR